MVNRVCSRSRRRGARRSSRGQRLDELSHARGQWGIELARHQRNALPQSLHLSFVVGQIGEQLPAQRFFDGRRRKARPKCNLIRHQQDMAVRHIQGFDGAQCGGCCLERSHLRRKNQQDKIRTQNRRASGIVQCAKVYHGRTETPP